MTRFQFNHRSKSASHSNPWKRRVGLVWLCLWLSVAAGFGYRHLTQETSGEVQAGIAAPATKTKPIEQIQVGERVAFAINPTETLDTSLSFDVNPRTWRKITLRTSQHEVVLLRPASWINEHLADGKSTMMLSVPEIGIDEPAEVISIWPCPPITPGKGRIVISTFTHIAPETICMYLEGLDEPIRCTPNHVTWSVEAKDFVEAHALHTGNLVLCGDGPRKISRVEKIAEPIRVYNLEVQGQHVYQVSSLGMLVHNASPGAYLAGKAPTQVAPGVRTLVGQYVDDLGRVQPWEAFYDDFGRLIARTDMNAGNATAGIPAIHHHIREFSRFFPLGRQLPTHFPGPYVP